VGGVALRGRAEEDHQRHRPAGRRGARPEVSLLDLHLLGSPVLRQPSPEVGAVDDEVRAFVADLFETMRASKGVGLAANQVGTALLARAIQHEIDHLDGILFIDRVGPFRRKFLLRQWEKSRKGQTGYIKRVTETAEDDAAEA